jgi:hypothetical protein
MTDTKPDFRTPLPIHRAAFRRIGPTLEMPETAREELRRRFQVDERSGKPAREMQGVNEVLSSVVWRWPWFEQRAAEFAEEGMLPRAWEEANIAPGDGWHDIPHGAKVRFVFDALMSALQTEKRLGDLSTMLAGAPSGAYWLDLRSGDQRCPATGVTIEKHRAAIRGGDHALLPPFFPGDRSYVELSDARSEERRAERLGQNVEQPPVGDPITAELIRQHARRSSSWWRFGR